MNLDRFSQGPPDSAEAYDAPDAAFDDFGPDRADTWYPEEFRDEDERHAEERDIVDAVLSWGRQLMRAERN